MSKCILAFRSRHPCSHPCSPSLLLPLPCTSCFRHTQLLTGPKIHWAFSNGDCTLAPFFVWRVLTSLTPFYQTLTIPCLTPVIPWTVACQAPLSMGFSRQEYCSGSPFPSPGESSWPRDRTQVSRIAGRCFTNWAMQEAPCHTKSYHLLFSWRVLVMIPTAPSLGSWYGTNMFLCFMLVFITLYSLPTPQFSYLIFYSKSGAFYFLINF